MTENMQLQTQAKREMSPAEQKFVTMRDMINRNLVAIQNAIPKHVRSERLVRIVLNAAKKTPKLLECSRESFMLSVLGCAVLGLEPDGLLGQAYLIPYGKECQLVPGYKGLIKLARQSGEIGFIDAHEVRIGDQFEFAYGADPSLKHEPAQAPVIDGKVDRDWRPGEISHFYAIAKLRDGSIQFCVMPVWEVDAIRDKSPGKNSTPWRDYYPEMGKKTALRRLCKLLPLSVEDNRLHQASEIDERADVGINQDLGELIDATAIEIPPEEMPTLAPEDAGKRMNLGADKPRVT